MDENAENAGGAVEAAHGCGEVGVCNSRRCAVRVAGGGVVEVDSANFFSGWLGWLAVNLLAAPQLRHRKLLRHKLPGGADANGGVAGCGGGERAPAVLSYRSLRSPRVVSNELRKPLSLGQKDVS